MHCSHSRFKPQRLRGVRAERIWYESCPSHARVSVEVRSCSLFQLAGGLDLAKGASTMFTLFTKPTRGIVATCLLGLAFLAGCSRIKPTSQDTETNAGGQTSVAPAGKAVAKQNKALVRFLNADPGVTRYDLWFEDSKTYTHVKYQRLTPYDELPATRGEFRLRASGWDDTEPIATQTGHLDSGKRYTVVALRDAEGNMALNVIADNLAPASEGKAKVRLINAASQFGEVDVIRQNDKKLLFKGINVNTATGYEDVEASTTTLEVREKGENRPALRIPNINLEAGKMYTIVVAGGTANTPLQAIPIEDELTQSVDLGL